MESIQRPPQGEQPFDSPFPLADEYPFSHWADLGELRSLHPVLIDLWDQVKRKYWFHGHPASNALFFAVYEMSRCRSFQRRQGGARE